VPDGSSPVWHTDRVRAPTSTRPVGGLALLSLALVLAGCTRTAEPPEATETPRSGSPVSPVSQQSDLTDATVVSLGVAGTDGRPRITQTGVADVQVEVSSSDGGALRTGRGPQGGAAIRFPAYTRAESYPRAVVRVQGSGADLTPGELPFSWGADVRLDRTSAGTPVDNGDNVVQRGLSSDDALFKAEVDRDRAACTARGDEGTVIVRSRRALDPGRWYRVLCVRDGDRLSVQVTDLTGGRTGRPWTSTASGPIGLIGFADPAIPLSVGGKLSHDGTVISSATDQFNGELTRPVVRFGH